MPMVIVLNGPPLSGKDTVADATVSQLANQGVCAVKVKFAGSLKDAVAAFLGLTMNERHAYFETPLKDEPSPLFFDMPPRQVLISFSEDWVKPAFGKQTFGEVLGQRIQSPLNANYEVFIISDGGFNEEVEGLRQVLGPSYTVKVVQLKRDGTDFKGDSRGWIDNPDATLYNNFSVDVSATNLAAMITYDF